MGIKLGNICRFQSGGTPSKGKPEFFNGTIPWITTTALNGGNIGKESAVDWISEQAIKESAAKIVPAFSIMVGTRVGVGKVAINTMSMSTSQDIISLLDIDESIWSKAFLCKFLQAKGTFLNAQARGATIKGIKIDVLSELELPEIPIEEQQHISQIIDKVKTTIAIRQSQLQKLDELVKARFVELFGDPKLNDKGWNAGIVSDYYEVKGGKRIPKGMGYADGVTAHPYLRATDMKNETILDDDIHYIDEEVYALIKRYTVKSGDVYLTNVGVNLGMAGIIPEKYDGANLTENAVKLVPKTEKVIDGVFLAHYINSPGIQDYINERKMSVGVPKLAIFRIETMPLLLPPMDIQMQFIEFCKQADKSKVAVQKALDEAQLLFDSLMQKYFG